MKPQTKRKGTATDTEGKVPKKFAGDEMIGEFGNQRSLIWAQEDSINYGPNEHIQSADEWYIDQQPRSKGLPREADLL